MKSESTTGAPPATIWTIGHSNSGADEFIAALRAHGIEAVADVRRFPGSRKHPQFGGPALAESLAANGIDSAWLARLGGRRRNDPGAQQLGWRNASFRFYAAFTWSEDFAEGLGELTNIAQAMPTAVMCSELLWWRSRNMVTSRRFASRQARERAGAVRPHRRRPARPMHQP